jgi:hypothetical protein
MLAAAAVAVPEQGQHLGALRVRQQIEMKAAIRHRSDRAVGTVRVAGTSTTLRDKHNAAAVNDLVALALVLVLVVVVVVVITTTLSREPGIFSAFSVTTAVYGAKRAPAHAPTPAAAAAAVPRQPRPELACRHARAATTGGSSRCGCGWSVLLRRRRLSVDVSAVPATQRRHSARSLRRRLPIRVRVGVLAVSTRAGACAGAYAAE